MFSATVMVSPDPRRRGLDPGQSTRQQPKIGRDWHAIASRRTRYPQFFRDRVEV